MSCTSCPAAEGPLCTECEALRWACPHVQNDTRLARELAEPLPAYSLRRERAGLWAEREKAVRTLLDPARMAERLRAMLEVRGVDVSDYGCDHGDVRVYLVDVYGADGNLCGHKVGIWIVGQRYPLTPLEGPMNIPALILALLDISRQAPDARERTLAALEEAS